ncbi:MAG: tetratricopeptide repeat protein [Acidobacteriota bacterium]
MVLVLVTGAVYLNSFPGAFHFDDFALLLENPDVTDPHFRLASFLDQYGGRPLTLWTFHWNYRWAGSDPLPYHWIQLALHCLAAMAVYGFTTLLTDNRRVSMTTALLFALHPLQTQPVNYIWSRSMLLMAIFGLTAMILIRRRPWMALICFQLAIWSRTEAVVLLLLLLMLDPKRWKGVAVVATVNVGGFIFGLLRGNPLEVGWNHPDVGGYYIAQPSALLKYVKLMFWPSGLHVDHDFQQPHWPLVLLGISALLGAVFLVWTLRHRAPMPALGLLWLMTPFIPSWLIPNSDLFNESRAYLALGGFAFLVSWVVWNTGPVHRFQPFRMGLAAFLMVAMIPTSLARNAIWKDDLALWRDAARKSPSKARVRYNLGAALVRRGQTRPAEIEFRKAHHLNPRDDLSYAALGYCAERGRRWEQARELYGWALKLNPSNRYARDALLRIDFH